MTDLDRLVLKAQLSQLLETSVYVESQIQKIKKQIEGEI